MARGAGSDLLAVQAPASPLPGLPDPVDADLKVIRPDRLGGLLHEYSQVACGGRVFDTDRLECVSSRKGRNGA